VRVGLLLRDYVFALQQSAAAAEAKRANVLIADDLR
jgi:hypothetical protein